MGEGREKDDEVRQRVESDCVDPTAHHKYIYFERDMKLARAFEQESSMNSHTLKGPPKLLCSKETSTSRQELLVT